jgi:hypothetical protein
MKTGALTSHGVSWLKFEGVTDKGIGKFLRFLTARKPEESARLEHQPFWF